MASDLERRLRDLVVECGDMSAAVGMDMSPDEGIISIARVFQPGLLETYAVTLHGQAACGAATISFCHANESAAINMAIEHMEARKVKLHALVTGAFL